MSDQWISIYIYELFENIYSTNRYVNKDIQFFLTQV
jgi:hypothetical protein